jgi:CRISPR/Cas system-associated exonuclease Cas4 (RecB family)
MDLQYERYPFTPTLGWSISRYELFDKCKRRYYYWYYGKYVSDVPAYKMKQLRALTSVPLEIGNVVHDVLEVFLRRLQKDDSSIDEQRFFDYALAKTNEYFSRKTFVETFYGQSEKVDVEYARDRVKTCLENFMSSPVYSWLFMKALRSKKNWMIEPEGYGETRLDGLKAYCKMDFLFPVDGQVCILDWKTGKKNEFKHSAQLIGYAAAANSNFHIPVERIFPKIVYLSPQFDELEIALKQRDFCEFFERVKRESEEMLSMCADRQNNVPKSIEHFPKAPSLPICGSCNFQKLCFPTGLEPAQLKD